MNPSDWLVLVVEDEDDSVRMISKILEHSGVSVRVARDGHECLEALETVIPTLVVMDLAMPGLDGWATLEAIRANPATAHLPVVAITAYHSASVAEQAIRAGFDAFYPKPVNARTFVQELATLIK